MLHLSPFDQSSLQSKLLSFSKHCLGLHGSVAQASLLGELGRQPLLVIWLDFYAQFCAPDCMVPKAVQCYGRLREQVWKCR
jgi:hypothetical protein